MIIKDFKTLPIPEQWFELWEYGSFLATVQTDWCNFSLYALHSFYVEVYSDPATNRVFANFPFKDTKGLEKYIMHIEVPELNII
ncbi:MAG: hypothetical protein COC08_00585 [Maribacter sp.]|nr:MAG: hypothetical protein COC08_00585 [Maribacter sp.]